MSKLLRVPLFSRRRMAWVVVAAAFVVGLLLASPLLLSQVTDPPPPPDMPTQRNPANAHREPTIEALLRNKGSDTMVVLYDVPRSASTSIIYRERLDSTSKFLTFAQDQGARVLVVMTTAQNSRKVPRANRLPAELDQVLRTDKLAGRVAVPPAATGQSSPRVLRQMVGNGTIAAKYMAGVRHIVLIGRGMDHEVIVPGFEAAWLGMNVYRNPLLDVALFDDRKGFLNNFIRRLDESAWTGAQADPLALPGFFGNDPFLHYTPIGSIPGVRSRFHFGFSSNIWKDDGTPVATTAGDPMAPTRSYTGEMADHNQFDAQFFVVLDGEFLGTAREDHSRNKQRAGLVAFEDAKLKAFADATHNASAGDMAHEFHATDLATFAPTAANIRITGTFQVGGVLRADYDYADANGDVEGESLYQWYISDPQSGAPVAISGAKARTYTLRPQDRGTNRKVWFNIERLRAATGNPRDAANMPIGASVIANVTGRAPTASNIALGGVFKMGGTITATFKYDDADGDAPGLHAYRWYRASPNATTRTLVGTGTSPQRTLVAADAGQVMFVEVVPTSADGSTGTAVLSPASAVVESNVVHYSNDTDVAIPDTGQWVESKIVVEDTGSIETLRIDVRVLHTWQSDLEIQLLTPYGKTLSLWNRQGTGADHVIRDFDYPDEALRSQRGVWTLRVRDAATRDVGHIDRWGLRFR